MAKKKIKIILQDCIECKYSAPRHNELVCRLKAFDEATMNDLSHTSPIVNREECDWFSGSIKC